MDSKKLMQQRLAAFPFERAEEKHCPRLKEIFSNWFLVRASPFLSVSSQGVATLGPVSRKVRKLFLDRNSYF